MQASLAVNDIVDYSKDVRVFPNPVTDFVNIENYSKEDIKSLSIFNSVGQRVYHVNRPENKTTVDVSGFASGVYYAEILLGAEKVSKKIIVK